MILLKKLQRYKHSGLLVFSLLVSTCGLAQDEDMKVIVGAGLAYNTNQTGFHTGGFYVTGEFSLSGNNSWYLNMNGTGGTYTGGGTYFQSHVLGTLIAGSFPDTETYDDLGGLTLVCFVFLPAGFTYYASENDTSRLGIYFNPMSSEYFNDYESEKATAYAPEFGIKYHRNLMNKTFIFISGGAAFTQIFGDDDRIPEQYSNGFIMKFTLGVSFFE